MTLAPARAAELTAQLPDHGPVIGPGSRERPASDGEPTGRSHLAPVRTQGAPRPA